MTILKHGPNFSVILCIDGFHLSHFCKKTPGQMQSDSLANCILRENKIILASFQITLFAFSFELRYILNFNIFQLEKAKLFSNNYSKSHLEL